MTSTIRHRTINPQITDQDAFEWQQYIQKKNPRASRKSDQMIVTSLPQSEDYPHTHYFSENRRNTTTQQPRKHIPWFIPAVIMLLVFYFGWVLIGTVGANFWITHFTSDQGPTHGTIINFTPKAGAVVEQVIAINNGGQVQIFVVPVDISKAKVYEGIDLNKIKFPQAESALIGLSTGDFNGDGLTDIRVDILSYTFSSPFHRVSTTYLLINDGKGNFNQQMAISVE